MRGRESLNPTGYLEIYKVYSDGREELHWEDKNVITSGMGVGLTALYSEQTVHVSGSILNYQIKYFQVGVSGSSNYGVSTAQLTSSVPLSFLSGASLVTLSANQHLIGSLFLSGQPFIEISQSNIQRASLTAARYNLIIPADSANSIGIPINEVGLFMRNPFNLAPQAPILVAYRYFSPILKTDEFALLFRWTINF